MRRSLLAALICCAAPGLVPAVAFAGPCKSSPSRYEVVHDTSTVAVLLPRPAAHDQGFQAFVCDRQRGKRTYLIETPATMTVGRPPHQQEIYRIAIAGHFVAFPFDWTEGADAYGRGIELVDAASGRIRDLENLDNTSTDKVGRVVVTARGVVAWTETGYKRLLQACLSHCTTDGIPNRTLDEGRTLDLHSLKVEGRYLVWRKSGNRRERLVG